MKLQRIEIILRRKPGVSQLEDFKWFVKLIIREIVERYQKVGLHTSCFVCFGLLNFSFHTWYILWLLKLMDDHFKWKIGCSFKVISLENDAVKNCACNILWFSKNYSHWVKLAFFDAHWVKFISIFRRILSFRRQCRKISKIEYSRWDCYNFVVIWIRKAWGMRRESEGGRVKSRACRNCIGISDEDARRWASTCGTLADDGSELARSEPPAVNLRGWFLRSVNWFPISRKAHKTQNYFFNYINKFQIKFI